MTARILSAAALAAALFVSGCNGTIEDLAPKAEKPLPQKIVNVMKAKGMTRTSPIMIRIFKEEGVLEVWKKKDTGRYDLVTSYEICKWSGKLGPKYTSGDRQAPEGFYTVRPGQMNPKSSYHLAFNIGFPNAYDQVNGRSGQHLMVHGACSSAGCYSMTDESVEEIYAFARDAFRGGQTEFQIQAFPFRMTAQNMARYKGDPNYAFWEMLKEGYDHFEITRVPPKVDVCEKRYVFNRMAEGEARFQPAGICPPSVQPEALQTAYQSYKSDYEAAFSAALGQGRTSAPKDSIAGLKEAKLVAEWSRKRARGERVTREPPSLAQPETAIARAEQPDAPAAEAPATETAALPQTAPAPQASPSAVASAPAAEQAPAARTAEHAAIVPVTAEPPTKAALAPATAEPRAFAPVSNLKRRLLGMFGS